MTERRQLIIRLAPERVRALRYLAALRNVSMNRLADCAIGEMLAREMNSHRVESSSARRAAAEVSNATAQPAA